MESTVKKKLTVGRFEMNRMVAWKILKLITGFDGGRKEQRGVWEMGGGGKEYERENVF